MDLPGIIQHRNDILIGQCQANKKLKKNVRIHSIPCDFSDTGKHVDLGELLGKEVMFCSFVSRCGHCVVLYVLCYDECAGCPHIMTCFWGATTFLFPSPTKVSAFKASFLAGRSRPFGGRGTPPLSWDMSASSIFQTKRAVHSARCCALKLVFLT